MNSDSKYSYFDLESQEMMNKMNWLDNFADDEDIKMAKLREELRKLSNQSE